MSRGLGIRQRLFLSAICHLENAHGLGRWFFVHAAVRTAWPGEAGALPTGRHVLRPGRDAERALNPTRIIAALAKRGLVQRNARRGPGASLRLTEAGRTAQ